MAEQCSRQVVAMTRQATCSVLAASQLPWLPYDQQKLEVIFDLDRTFEIFTTGFQINY